MLTTQFIKEIDRYRLAVIKCLNEVKIKIYEHPYLITLWDQFLASKPPPEEKKEDFSLVISRKIDDIMKDYPFAKYLTFFPHRKREIIVYVNINDEELLRNIKIKIVASFVPTSRIKNVDKIFKIIYASIKGFEDECLRK
jgi:hypothetical protein